ncbi:ABC transporter ATP-binding protein [Pseudomonas sp. MWU13-2105]|uniref:ABC transporter ATP-binding protein n=1 Tax=Pseudomonas sp. MWU13-2105 TaxID=2935074 RepID=UPI00201004CD|nr:ATP-binding cassette domain-containing protein [Pseudomonas sp. MWU13-2105]
MNNWKKLYLLFLHHLKARDRTFIISTIACTLVAASCLSTAPLILGRLTDSLLKADTSSAQQIIITALLYLLLIAIPKLINSVIMYLQSLLRLSANQTLLGRYFNYLCLQSENFFSQKNPGELSQEVNQASNDLFIIVRNLSFSIVSPIVQIGIAVVVLILSKNTFVAMAMAIYVLLFLINNIFYARRLTALKMAYMTAGRNTYATLTDSISNINVARQYNAYDFLLGRYNKALKEDRQSQSHYWTTMVRMQIINALLFVGLFGVSFMLALYDVIYNGRSVGNFVLIGAYTLTLLSPIESLGNMFTEINQALRTFATFVDKISIQSERRGLTSRDTPPHHWAVAFDRVTLTYPGKEHAALSDVSFSIKPGECVVITGPSGAGKSTIAKILMKQYTHDAGSVCVFDTNLAEIDLHTASEKIGFVSQEVFAFKDTLRFNLLVAHPSASDHELLQALDKAELRDYLTGLPQGLDTVLGDRGVTLSGGQRQRLALARLFLRQPDIILLDEATSSLDVVTEKRILQNIVDAFQDKTILIITHRATALSMADRVMVVSAGQIEGFENLKRLKTHNVFINHVLDADAKGLEI